MTFLLKVIRALPCQVASTAGFFVGARVWIRSQGGVEASVLLYLTGSYTLGYAKPQAKLIGHLDSKWLLYAAPEDASSGTL